MLLRMGQNSFFADERFPEFSGPSSYSIKEIPKKNNIKVTTK